MSTIDAHVHLYPPEVCADPAGWAAAHREPHWATMCTRRRKNGAPVQGFPSVDDLLRAMDAGGIGRAVLLGWYWNQPESCVLQNQFYVACVKSHPDRLAGFATIHPAMGEGAVKEEIRAAHEDGLIGIGELSPHAQDAALDDPVLWAALELAADLKMPVNFHVTDPAGRPYPGRVETPLQDFITLARTHPRTTFILAHWGGLLPLVDSAANELTNIYYDTAASPLLYDAGIWQRFLKRVAVDRVLFGSDFPLNLYPQEESQPELKRIVAEIRDAGWSSGEIEKVLHGNAGRVFRFGSASR